MKLYLVETITGVYAVDKERNIKAKQVWPADPKTIAKIMLRLRKGDTSLINDLVYKLKSINKLKVFSDNKSLVEALKDELNIEYSENIEAIQTLKTEWARLAVDDGFLVDESEYCIFNHQVLNEITRTEVHEKLSGREALLIPAVQLLSELDTVLNGLSSRMREWYGVHFPEMGARVKEHEDYARIITQKGLRDHITAKGLMEMSLKKKDAEKIEDAAATSMGAYFDDVDIKIVSDYAQRTLDLYKYREQLVGYISLVSQEVAPNLAFIAGPVLAAKLIEKAGSLKKLGMIPSSTIQVLGAEKAMFRAVKSKAKPPKHGLLYQHPYVNGASRDKRGRRARSLAAKIAIAARADLFSGDFIAEELVAQLDDY